jgi:alkaline phosphatase D
VDRSTQFAHGVASFDPTATSVLLWTRLEHGGRVDWVVARDPGLQDAVATGSAEAPEPADRTVHVEVDGLEPATRYWYRFDADGVSSPVGRTRTLADDDSAVRLGLVCCSRYSVAPLTALRAVAQREVDLVVHLGDYIYEDDGHKGPRRHEPPRPAVTLDDYRARIAQIRRDPDAQALHQRHPMVLVWDDHDLADNAYSTGSKAHDERTQGPWSARVEAAARARQEWMPQRLAEPTKTWRSVDLGRLGQLVLLDTRIAGRDQQAGDEGTKPLDDPDRSLLGDEQRTWLHERLADTTRPWAVVVSSVVVGSIDLPLPGVPGLNHLLSSGYAYLDGRMMHDDQWDGYPAERARLRDAMAARAAADGRTLVLSGDVHSSWAFAAPCTEDGRAVAVEVTTPAVSSEPMARTHPPGLWVALDQLVERELEHVPFADLTHRGFSIAEITPDEAVVRWWYVDPFDPRPVPDVELGGALRTSIEGRIGWTVVDGERFDPVDGDAVDGLPTRPADLPRLARRRTLARRGLAALGLGVPVATALSVRRLRRRRG